MILNGKFFVPAEEGDLDFKALFRRLATAGVGRPVDEDGLPKGPWTPDLLTEAIAQIDANRKGIDLRTVQLWFQDNQKGVSPENIRWLARVFGCGDAEATSAWMAELSAAQARLAAKRRAARSDAKNEDATAIGPPMARRDEKRTGSAAKTPVGERSSLALWSERLFVLGGTLNLPAAIFAGAAALQFVAYFLGLHSITYVRPDGIEKQVGFHWAPNWSFLFMLFLPLFTIFAGDLVAFWRTRGRAALLNVSGRSDEAESWPRKVERSSTTFWVVGVICLIFAGLLQWISFKLLPLLEGSADGVVDWGSVALLRPDVVSIPGAAGFTGFAYLYMGLSFYVMSAGLVLLYTLADDFWDIGRATIRANRDRPAVAMVGRRMMNGFFRCAAMGLFIAITMGVQSRYLRTDAPDIWTWLIWDAATLWPGPPSDMVWDGYGFALRYTSLLVALPMCIVMLYAIVRVAIPLRMHSLWLRMALALSVIVAAYMFTAAFPGFAVLLGTAVLIAFYGLLDPTYGERTSLPSEGGQHDP